LKAEELPLVMKQALEKSEVLGRRFRHVASRSLMILRKYKGNSKSVGKQQMNSRLLMSAVRRISDDFRYFVNVGSVGQPRDGDPRSCYVIYDSDERYISFRRVEFHLEGYFASLKAHKLSVHPSMLGNMTGRVVDFNPLNMPDIMGLSNATNEENLAKELNERFEKLTDRREAETRVEPPSKPKKGKTLKATRAKAGGVARTRTMTGHDSSRMGSTTRMRPKSRSDNTATQKAPQRKSAAAPLLLIIGGIILIGVIVAIIMVFTSR